MDIKLSVFTGMAPELKPKEILSLLKDLGYDGVEWRCKQTSEEIKNDNPSFWGNNLCTITPESNDDQLSELEKLTRESDIEPVSVTSYLTCGDLKQTERILQIAQKLGAATIRLGVPGYDRTSNYNELFDKATRYLSECEQLCKQYGVKGLVETHHFQIAASASLAHRLVKSFNPDYIGVLYDPGNMVIEGHENYRMGMELLGPYLAHVHAKNAAWKPKERNKDGTINWESPWVPVPDGIVNWKEVLKDLKAIGYEGYIGMEDFSGAYDTKESIKYNLDWFKKVLRET